MVGVEQAWHLGLPQGLDFIPRPIAEVLADLHHDDRVARIERLQEGSIEIPELNFSILGLGQLDFQQQDVARQQDVDIRLAEISPGGICVPNPLIVVDGLRVGKVSPELAQDSPLIGLAFGSGTFELWLLACPGAILQNLAASQALNPMIRIRRLGHWYLPGVSISSGRAHPQSARPALIQTWPPG